MKENLALGDWWNDASHLLLNDRMPLEQRKKMLSFTDSEAARELPAHVFLMTSGSTSAQETVPRMAALSKTALLASARAVNEWVQAGERDIWLNPLPEFHVGGLSILARASDSKSEVISFNQRWQPEKFLQALENSSASLTSLVPTQVYDLVHQQLSAPPSLRVVFVGGAALSDELYLDARKLGWPLLPSFGCTEACSQVATASLQSLEVEVALMKALPSMKLLPHWQVKASEKGCLLLKGEALFSGYVTREGDKWQRVISAKNGWWQSEDRVKISKGEIRFLGRESDFVKVNGEGVDLSSLRQTLQELEGFAKNQVELLALEDERAGSRLVLVGEISNKELHRLSENFNQRVMPFQRVQEVFSFEVLPRSPLGKLLRGEVLKKIELKR